MLKFDNTKRNLNLNHEVFAARKLLVGITLSMTFVMTILAACGNSVFRVASRARQKRALLTIQAGSHQRAART
jgi:hypothetical protein